ncbi:MAG: hypothetical protein V1695_04180 [Candidatus Uhrbacteria bacterium]
MENKINLPTREEARLIYSKKAPFNPKEFALSISLVDSTGKVIKGFDRLDSDQKYYWLLSVTGPYGETLIGGSITIMGEGGEMLGFSASDMVRGGLAKFLKMYEDGERSR